MDYQVPCPYCKGTVEVDEKWILENERVFCTNCTKAFDVKLKEEYTEEESSFSDDNVINSDDGEYW